MLVKPSVNELLTKVDNRYTLVIMVSKRARQIASGSKTVTDVKSNSVVSLATNEVAEGKVVLC